MSSPKRGKARRAVQPVTLPARNAPPEFLSLSQLLAWLPPAGTIEVGLLAVVFLIPLVQFNAAHESFELPKQITLRLIVQAIAILVGAVGVVSWFGVERGARRRTLREGIGSWLAPAARWQPLAAAGAILLAWSLATAMSIAPLESFWGAWYRWSGWHTQLYYLMLFLLAAWTLTRRTQLVRVAAVAAAAGSVASVYAIIQGTVQRQLIYEITKNFRPYSTFGNSNFLGDYLALTLLLTLGGVLGARDHVRRASWGLAVALQAFALVLTQTRGAWVGIAAGLALGIILLIRQRGGPWQRWLLAITAAGVLLLTGLWAGQDTLRRIGPLSRVASMFDTREATIATRLVLWRTGVELWSERPLVGYGPDTVATVLPRRLPSLPDQREVLGSDAVNEVYDRAHNATLDALTAVGVAGWLTLAATAALVLWHGWRLTTPSGVSSTSESVDADSLRGHPLAAAAVAALVAYQIAQQFNIETAGPSSLAWILGGALVGAGARAYVSQRNDNRTARGTLRNPARQTSLAHGVTGAPTLAIGFTGAIAVVLLGLVVWWDVKPLVASAAYKQGMELAKAKRAAEAVSAYERAVSWWPYEHRYWAELAYARRFAARSLADAAGRNTFNEAIDAVDRALQISPQNALLMSYLGDIAGEAAARWNDAALAERAIQSHARALQIAPNRWTYHSMAGLTHLRLNRAAGARDVLEKAIALYDGDWLTWSRLGDASAALGDRQTARRAYEQALKLNPGQAEIKKALEQVGG